MPQDTKRSAQIIVDEIRRQVDLQVKAADGLDTRAMAIFAGVAAVAAVVASRVSLASNTQRLAASVTLVALLAALGCLLQAVRGRIGGFSNGPDVEDLAAYAQLPASDLEHELVDAFVKVRQKNESFLKCKARWVIRSLVCLIVTVAGIAWLAVEGGLQ